MRIWSGRSHSRLEGDIGSAVIDGGIINEECIIILGERYGIDDLFDGRSRRKQVIGKTVLRPFIDGFRIPGDVYTIQRS